MNDSAQLSVFKVDSPAPTRVDAYLATQIGRSRAYVQAQISQKRVLLNGAAVERSSERVQNGDELQTQFEEVASLPSLQAVEATLDILFEDEAVLVINKPQGLVVHPAPGTSDSTLVHHLLHYLKNTPHFEELSDTRPGIVHRLDRGTSGVILVGKTGLAHERLAKQFHDRIIKKRYEAIVWGQPEKSGTISSLLGRSKKDRTRMTSKTNQGKPALTAWQTLQSVGLFSHVALYPKTGRTHQLRVHLADMGNPIVGDPTYKRSDYFRKLPELSLQLQERVRNSEFPYLHAQAIEFQHPLSEKPILIEAPRPDSFEKMLQAIQTM